MMGDYHYDTKIGGFYRYHIYNNDGIKYSSTIKRNLILDTGFQAATGEALPNLIKGIDFGVGVSPASGTQKGILSKNYASSNIFTDLSALSASESHTTSSSVYSTYFRTYTTNTPVTLTEFAIKPGKNRYSFARNVVNIPLGRGDGIIFEYDLRVVWPMGRQIMNLPMTFWRAVSSTGVDATTGASPSAYTTSTFPVTAHYFRKPGDHQLFNNNYYMYTLSGNEALPEGYNTNYPTGAIKYSSGEESNSYAQQLTTNLGPASARATYTFGPLSGFNNIKTLLLNLGRTTTNPTSAFFAIQWDLPPVLSGQCTVDGALYKPLSSASTVPDYLFLSVDMIHTFTDPTSS